MGTAEGIKSPLRIIDENPGVGQLHTRYVFAFVVAVFIGGRLLAQQPQELQIPPQPPPAPPSALLQNYPAVTAERLTRPVDGEWLMLRRTYDGWGYSPLKQITPKNVSRLRPVWVMSTGVTNAQ